MTALNVLIIDDEPAIRQVLAVFLGKAGYAVEQAANGMLALERLAKGDVDVALCDISMPVMNGIDVIKQARASGIDTSFIMMTAFASIDNAIDAMKAGAIDFMIKPVRNEEVLHRIRQIGDLRGLRDENKILRSLVLGAPEEHYHFASGPMQKIERLVGKVAPTDSTILITGESGTGKGVLARAVHQQSLRSAGPFIPVNCGAIPENLLESEFFGHTKGAFTGADKARKGLFLQADKGTLFLDEIGELPLPLQAKLLHTIEDKEVRPIGTEVARKVDVRIIAATNRNLSQEVSGGRFREDLYFRISVFHVDIPPLRERSDDMAGFLAFLLKRNARRLGPDKRLTVDPDVEEMLLSYGWPGNVREFENVLDRAMILADDGRITMADLPPSITRVSAGGHEAASAPQLTGTLREQLRRIEAGIIQRTIDEAGGDRRLAAQRLGIGLSSLYRKLEEYEEQQGLDETQAAGRA
ncbi:MAG: sigma-54-dependent Fis family transcriptional regulator [Betaproteobacteria bacterium]|nr:sigma-54-dependent Fis family transcriptional regulator [Betaproteobacteria bacterium]